FGLVEAAGRRKIQAVAQRQRAREEDAEGLRIRVHPRERVADEDAARHRAPRRVEGTELRARIEPDVALVVREPGDELSSTAADVRRPARLQTEAEPVLL